MFEAVDLDMHRTTFPFNTRIRIAIHHLAIFKFDRKPPISFYANIYDDTV